MSLRLSILIEKSLGRTLGVQRAMVNFVTEKATVDYLPNQATPAAPKEAVINACYGVVERAPGTSAAELDRQKALAYQQLKRRFWVAVGLVIVIMPLSMLILWPAMMQRVNGQWLNYLLLFLTLPTGAGLQRARVLHVGLERLPARGTYQLAVYYRAGPHQVATSLPDN